MYSFSYKMFRNSGFKKNSPFGYSNRFGSRIYNFNKRTGQMPGEDSTCGQGYCDIIGWGCIWCGN
jgi:hypothetical protein